jgi:hypothetical protein
MVYTVLSAGLLDKGYYLHYEGRKKLIKVIQNVKSEKATTSFRPILFSLRYDYSIN